MEMIEHLREASGSGLPVDLLLTNGHRVTGIPFLTQAESPETVTVSTGYEYKGFDGDHPVKGANESGYYIDPDKAPWHVRIEHISTFAYTD